MTRKTPTVYLSKLVLEIEERTGLDGRDIRLILDELGTSVGEHLSKKRRVCVDGLGTFGVHQLRVMAQSKSGVAPTVVSRVSFRKAKRLKEKLR